MRSIYKKFIIAVEITRPFTLVAPALGIISGALTAYGAAPKSLYRASSLNVWIIDIIVASLMASLLNGASNILNQIYDIEIDKINKPNRVLPTGRMTVSEAKILSFILYSISVPVTLTINIECFFLYLTAAIATILYSMPPFRFKRNGWLANFTIAIPRGVLLKVAGWSITKSIFSIEAWLIGIIFGLFLFGATNTKDFADIKGDRENGCKTLPIMYGKDKTVKIIYPFFTIPFLILIIFSVLNVLTGNKTLLILIGIVCLVWAHIILRMIDRAPQEVLTENHPSWYHMYYLMFFMQISFMLAYLI